MTISSTVRIAGPYIGSGAATVFPFAFKVFAAAEMQVAKLNTTSNVETILVLTTDYTVQLNGDQNSNPGGTITLPAVLASGYNLTITSDIANLQPTDLTNQGGFYPEVITDALDRATIQIQQLDQNSRAIKIPLSDGVLDMTTPVVSARQGKYLAFDTFGLPVVSSGTGSDSALRTDLANATAVSAGSRLSGFRQDGTGATARTVDAKLKDAVSVKDFGATGDGVTDDTTAIRAAIAYQQTTGIGNATPTPSHYSKFWVHFPKGKYVISGNLSNNIEMNGLYLCGDHAVLNVSAGITAIGNINYMASFKGLTFSGGLTHIAIATNNPDTNMINIDECEFIEPTGSAITTASGSNSTQLSVTRCKFHVTNNANSQVCNIDTCDYARFEKCWVAANTAGTKAAFEINNCNLTITEMVGVDYSSLTYWIKMSGTGGGLYAENNRFGAENAGPSGAIVWWQIPSIASSVGGIALIMKNCMAYSTGPLVKFDAVPNIVDITGQFGLVLTPPAFVSSSITTTNIQQILGDSTNWFNIEINGWNYNKLIDATSTSPTIAIQGIPIAQEGVSAPSKPTASSLVIQTAANTGSYTPTYNSQYITATTGTNIFGVGYHQLQSTNNDAYFNRNYTTILSGFTAGIYTAIVDIEVTTDTALEPRVKAGTHIWQGVLTKGSHTICVPFYYDTSGTVAGNTITIDHYSMPSGSIIRIHRIRVFSGHVIVCNENSDLLGTAAPVGTIQAYVGDVVQNAVPASAGYIGWVCTTAGIPGTWRTYGLIS